MHFVCMSPEAEYCCAGGWKMKAAVFTGLFALLVIVAPAAAQQSPQAGRIKVASGSVNVVRNGTSASAQAGQAVYVADTLRTGADGHVGVILDDDTRISLGPNSEIQLN